VAQTFTVQLVWDRICEHCSTTMHNCACQPGVHVDVHLCRFEFPVVSLDKEVQHICPLCLFRNFVSSMS
jgi:hypothetical protein